MTGVINACFVILKKNVIAMVSMDSADIRHVLSSGTNLRCFHAWDKVLESKTWKQVGVTI